MRINPVFMIHVFFLTACSGPSILEMPTVASPPSTWDKYSTVMIPDSQCPDIGGVYLDPPSIHKEGNLLEPAPAEIELGSYYRHFPLHTVEKKEAVESEVEFTEMMFLIRQPTGDSFYFSFLTDKLGIVEYQFQADEGDFNCKDGFIEFPIISRYGMIEATSANYQVRNRLTRDDSGALIVQETTGPYRGNPSTAAQQFRNIFLRYPQYVESSA